VRPNSASNCPVSTWNSCVERHPRLRAVVLSEIVVVVPPAVDQVAVVPRVDAVGGERVGAPRRQVRRRHDAGQQAGEVGEVARDGRDVRQFLGADVAADLLRGDVDDRRLAADRDRFLERADFERDVDRQLVANGERDVAAEKFLEALQLRRDLIFTRRQRRREPRSVGSADHVAEVARVLVRHRDGHAGQRGLLLIDDAAAHFSRALLSERERGSGEEEERDERQTTRTNTHIRPPCQSNRVSE
jgi:hypothetical protein